VRWLGELAKHSTELGARKIGVVGIAADTVADTAALQTELAGVTLLTDPDVRASTAWGVHEPGAENPTPSTFVVGGDGVVRWRKLPDDTGDWPSYADVAAALAI